MAKLLKTGLHARSRAKYGALQCKCRFHNPVYLVNKPLQAAGMSADNVRG